MIEVYTPQTGCKEEEKDDFRAILDVEIPKNDLVILGGDLNAHVGKVRDSYKRHHGGFGYGEGNEGEHVLKFAQAFDLALTNTYFKKNDSLIAYEVWYKKTQIDYMLISHRRLKDIIDCKVIPCEDIAAQHKLLVMDLHITNKSTQNKIKLKPCIKWGRLK
ncbi:craniofacial development protein 2-like [Gordionus sp. m RMFG-2023]|uniref:craniofacial development protein 2-like n=1 Tax=Gordionus sp. m RMFG-2023 TaxID=3053472 RepID=UPI0031FE20B8